MKKSKNQKNSQNAKRVKQKVGFVVGATLTSVKFEGSYFDYLTKIDFPASVNATPMKLKYLICP